MAIIVVVIWKIRAGREEAQRQMLSRIEEKQISDSYIRFGEVTHLHESTIAKRLCVICLGSGVALVTLCHHAFHTKCLVLWSKRSNKCPECNESLGELVTKCEYCRVYRIVTTVSNIVNPKTMCVDCRDNPTKEQTLLE